MIFIHHSVLLTGAKPDDKPADDGKGDPPTFTGELEEKVWHTLLHAR